MSKCITFEIQKDEVLQIIKGNIAKKISVPQETVIAVDEEIGIKFYLFMNKLYRDESQRASDRDYIMLLVLVSGSKKQTTYWEFNEETFSSKFDEAVAEMLLEDITIRKSE